MIEKLRASRILFKKLLGKEPVVRTKKKIPIEFHGNKEYGGWGIPANFLNANSKVIDVGLGEDISFSESIISKYGVWVHGFDPTPKSIEFIEKKKPNNFTLHKYGLGGENKKVDFFLPNNLSHVSGSIKNSSHVGGRVIEVELLDVRKFFEMAGKTDRVDILKIDIEGAEYEVLSSPIFKELSKNIAVICIEFHHRWPEFGVEATNKAVSILENNGFDCVWQSRQSNEEFTFINRKFF